MPTLTIPASTAAIELTVDGGDPFQHLHAIPSAAVALNFGTGGAFIRRIEIGDDPAALAFSTSSGSDQVVVRELLAGAGIELQVWDRSDPKGTMLERLEFREQMFEWVLSDTGSIDVTLPRSYLGSVLAEEDHHIVVVVDGIERARFIAEDLIEIPVSEDERQSVKLVGRGIGACLEWGAVAPYDFGGPNQRVKRAWNNSTRATALRETFDEVQNREILPDVIVDGWDGVYGSTGAVWPDLIDIEFDAGGSWLDLLQSWTEFGIEWMMTHDMRLQLAPSFGRPDLHETVVLYPAHTVKHQELSISRRDIRTILFTQDGAGGVQRIDAPEARTQWGDREQYAVFSDAAGAGTASANGYLLLDLIKDAVKERRVEIDPNVPGRRPFVDFDLGDVVGVWFGDDVYAFRVLAIAMGTTDTGRIRCEVTLEYMLEAQRKRRLRLLNASTAGGGISSGPQMVYAVGGGDVIGTTKVSILPLSLNAFVATLAKVGFCLIGTSSTAQTVMVEIMYGEVVLETLSYTVPSGVQTIEATWLWTQVPQGEAGMRLRLSVNTGTFTIGANQAQFWVEAKGIAGSQVIAPVIYANDEVNQTPTSIVDEVQIVLPGLAMSAAYSDEALQDIVDVTDSVVPFVFRVDAFPAAAGDDGYIDDTTMDTAATTTVAGRIGGVERSAFYRFAIPQDLTGKTIVAARLTATANTTNTVATTELALIDAADPAAPTDRTDYLSKTLTTERRDWVTTTTAGTVIVSPDFTAMVQELVDSYGNLPHIVVMHRDDTSASNGRMEFRAFGHLTGPAVKLSIEYLD